METKFKFNSAICTSRVQSERLLALGLRKETADMTIHIKNDDGWYVTAEPFYEWEDDMNTLPCLEETEPILPAWSLNRLIEMMPMTLIEDRIYHEYWELNVTPIMVIYRNQDESNEWIGECLGQGMYNNIIDCIEWLIKEGYFNKEYLEE